MDSSNLTGEAILKLIERYKVRQVPRLEKLQNIYIGKHDILNRTMDSGKPNNKIVLDYPSYITNIMTGYFMGKPVTYKSEDNNSNEFLLLIQQILDFNSEDKENVELSKEMSIKGESYELLYIDEDKNICFTQIPAEQLIIYYEPNLKKKIDFAIRFYNVADILSEKEITKIELYTSNSIKYYTKVSDTELQLENEIDHYFGEVPIIHFVNNKEKLGDWEKVLSLVNDLEERLSDNSNELEAFRNAYIVATGLGLIEPEDFEKFKQVGAMALPDKDDKVEFLTKNINDNFSEHHIERTIDLIHKMAMIPDLSDKNFSGNVSGIAIQFKLYCMEQIAAIKEQNFNEALNRRLKLITNMLNLKELTQYNSKELTPVFIRNIPANLTELADMAYKLKGIVSDETLLTQFPFITDIQSEIEKLDSDAEKEIIREQRKDTFVSALGYEYSNPSGNGEDNNGE